MTDLQIALFIIVPSVILVGALIFFLSGVYHVKDNQVMIIEKYDAFYKECPKGRYFFFPLIYKRRGVYTTSPMEKDIKVINGKVLTITYQVVDAKKYHYTKESIEFLVNKANQENTEMNKKILDTTLDNMGLKFLGIREKGN